MSAPRPLARRSFVAAAAWTTPAVVLASAAPAFAASGPDIQVAGTTVVDLTPGTMPVLTYVVTNVGDRATTGATTMRMPSSSLANGYSFVTAPPGWISTTQQNFTVWTHAGSITPGTNHTFQVAYNPPRPFPSAYTVAVSTGTDAVSTNNTASTQLRWCDLEVEVLPETLTMPSQGTLRISYLVHNRGNGPATGALRLEMSALTAWVTETSARPAGWSREIRVSGAAFYTPATYSLAGGATARFDLVWERDPSLTGVTSRDATATLSWIDPDAVREFDLTNNSDAATIAITP